MFPNDTSQRTTHVVGDHYCLHTSAIVSHVHIINKYESEILLSWNSCVCSIVKRCWKSNYSSLSLSYSYLCENVLKIILKYEIRF